MAGMVAGYDLSVATFSPDGRVFQITYAANLVDASSSSVAAICSDGVIFGSEKCLISDMLVPRVHRKVFAIDEHVGMVVAGLLPDARQIVNQGREEAALFKSRYGERIPISILAERIASYVHSFTLYWSTRPFGTTLLLGGIEDGCPDSKGVLYCIEPSGTFYNYYSMAVGKGKQIAKAELEKLNFRNLTCKDAIMQVCKVLHRAHEEFKDQKMEIDIAVVSADTDGKFEIIDEDVQKKAEEEALDILKERDE